MFDSAQSEISADPGRAAPSADPARATPAPDPARATPGAATSSPIRIRAIAVAAIAWSLAFAAIHLAWALGSTAGLDGRRVTGVLLVIDVVAIPLCLLAAWVAWQLRDDVHARQAPRSVRRLAWAAAAVLGLRGLGTVQALIAPPDDATLLTRLVDPYFLLGGMLFALLARAAKG